MSMSKKKLLAVITSVVLSGGMLSAMPLGNITTAEALLVDDCFDVNYDGWTNLGDSTIVETVTDVNFNSLRSMHVSGRTCKDDGACSEKSFYIDGGRSYKFDVKVYHEQPDDENFNLSMTYLLPDGKTFETKTICSKKAVSDEWTDLEAKFKAPSGVSNLVLKITTDSTADFYFDDFKITGKESVPATVSAASAGLKDIYANYFRVGSVLNGYTVNQSTITSVILKEYNSITFENELKPDATMNKSNSSGTNIGVSLSSAASILNFCAQNGIGVRGHTLIWHSQTPQWVFKDGFNDSGSWVSKDVMDKRMESYIKNMFSEIEKQYPTLNLYAYDVCNECVSDDSTRTKNNGGAREPGYGNGKSPWVQVYGDNSFIEKAFTYAKQYAPSSCSLFYNDYNEYWDHKRDCIASMCESLYKKGLLDGIGMQSHVNGDISGFSGVSAYTAAMRKFAAIGCQVQITELDVSTESGKFASSQPDKYKAIFQAAVDLNKTSSAGKVTAVCVWGPNDANTWIDSKNSPLLYDTNNKPKDAYYSVAGVVPESEWGDGGSPSTPVTKPVEPDENGYLFHDDFESSEGSWSPRGSVDMEISNKAAYAGSKSLLVSGRTSEWNGVQKSLGSVTFKPGQSYSFSADAAYADGSDAEFIMTLQYTDAAGETQYEHMDTKSASDGKFVQLSAKDYKIPSGASDVQLVIETSSALGDFYVDEAIAAVSGTPIDGPSEIKIVAGDVNCDGKINVADLCYAKAGVLTDFDSKASATAADVDQNKVVNSKDLIMLQEYLLGIISEFEKDPSGPVTPPGDDNPPVSITPKEYMKNFSSKIAEYPAAGITDMKGGVDYGTLKKYTYNSTTRGRMTNVNVLLPPGYNPNEKYPVLYAMHGYWEDEGSLMTMGKVQNILGNLIASGEAEKMIVVFPYIFTSKTQEKCSGMDLNNSLAYDNFINDLVKDLMPYIESNFSVKTGRENTAITGFSMGARESLFIGMTRSDLFGYVGSACAAPGLTPGANLSTHPGQLKESELKPKYDMPYLILLTCGGTDSVVYDQPATYSRFLTQNGVDHLYHLVSMGGHGDSSVQPHFYNLLRGLFKAK